MFGCCTTLTLANGSTENTGTVDTTNEILASQHHTTKHCELTIYQNLQYTLILFSSIDLDQWTYLMSLKIMLKCEQ